MLVVAATLLLVTPALRVASESESVTEASYETNTSDALVLRVSWELLVAGRSPFDMQQQAEWISTTRLGGRLPPYTLPFAYPPNALPLFALYGVGSPRVAMQLFVFCGTLVLLGGALLLLRRLDVSPWVALLALSLLALSGPTLFNARLGQTGALVGGLACVFAAGFRDRDAASGIALGLLAFKPQYAVVLAMAPLAARRYRLLAYAVLATVASSAVSALLFGLQPWSDFVRAVTRPNHTVAYMVSWVALATRAGVPSVVAARLGLPVLALAVVALLLACRALVRRGDDGAWGIALCAATAVVVSPNTHAYDLTLWAVPLAILVRPAGSRAWVAAQVVWPIAWMLLVPSRRLGLLLSSIVILALVLARALERQRAPV